MYTVAAIVVLLAGCAGTPAVPATPDALPLDEWQQGPMTDFLEKSSALLPGMAGVDAVCDGAKTVVDDARADTPPDDATVAEAWTRVLDAFDDTADACGDLPALSAASDDYAAAMDDVRAALDAAG